MLAAIADIVGEIIGIMLSPVVIAIAVFLAFVALGYVVGRFNVRLLTSIGVDDLVEGTTFERTAQGLGSSTVAVMARLTSWFIYGVGALVALHLIGVLDANLFWQEVTIFVPRLFVAVIVLIIGIVVGEKVALVVNERLKGIKLPEVAVVAVIAKYSVIFLAALIALGQIGVEMAALLIVLAAYAFGLVFLIGIACRDLLTAGATGVYLLLRQPYSIGDEIRVDGKDGIVQEVDLFITQIESDGTEYMIPNHQLLRDGVALIR